LQDILSGAKGDVLESAMVKASSLDIGTGPSPAISGGKVDQGGRHALEKKNLTREAGSAT